MILSFLPMNEFSELSFCDWNEVMWHRAITSTLLCNEVNELRKHLHDKDAYTKKKLKLGGICCGSYANKIRKRENLIKIDGMIFDIDKLGSIEAAEEVKELLKSNKYVRIAFISPSGDGIKFGVQLDRFIEKPNKYTENYKSAKKYFQDWLIVNGYSIELDKTSDPTRICFHSGDSNCYLNTKSLQLKVKHVASQRITKVFNHTEPPKYMNVDNDIQDMIEKARRTPRLCYDDWVAVGMSLASEGEQMFPVWLALSLGKDSKDTETSLRRKWNSWANKVNKYKIATFFKFCK